MAETGVPPTTTKENASNEIVEEEAIPVTQSGFPPYPPYATETIPPSVADTIIAGRDLRVQYKSTPKKNVRPPPKPAKPKGPKATDVKMTKRALRAHARCLRRHGAILTDRLEHMSKPPRRSIIYLWREYAHTLPAETIARLRAMLDADEPFKPDQAYEYFINVRKTKKKVARTSGVNSIKKDIMAMYGDKRFEWARNATVAFARGIQQRLARPGTYVLGDRMLRLSNIILDDICGYMNMKTPSRRCIHPKAKFMMEMADKVTVWIDEILAESEDRMLMMDFDEDEDQIRADETGDTGFTDDFLNMMSDGGLLKGPQSAYLKFTGEMLEAFLILTDSMYAKGEEKLLSYGKFSQTFSEAADELKQAPDFEATEYSTVLATELKNSLAAVAKPNTPNNIVPFMKDMVEICSNYLAQNAEFSKDKGPAFKILLKAMQEKKNEQLYQKGKAKRTYAKAAAELKNAKGLDAEYDDPNLSQEIHSKLSHLVATQTPADLKPDMSETLNVCSKYLSQAAIDEIERGPAFDILINELEKKGADPFMPQYIPLASNFATAYVLKSAPGFSSVSPDPSTSPMFANALHKVVDTVTPKTLAKDMQDVIVRCSNYLSAFLRDRDKAYESLIKMMKSNANKELAKRNNYAMNYGTGANELDASPTIIAYMAVKDIAEEARINLTKDMEGNTPPEMQIPVKALIKDVSKFLSQPIAMRSGIAGERYPLNFLAAVKKSLGTRPLYKYKCFGQTYTDAAEELKYAGQLESNPKCENLKAEISSEMKRGIPTRLAPTITSNLNDTMEDASKHLAKVGTDKGEALQHLVNLMKEEGETPLGLIQGYQQSYKDGARRIENAPTLTNEKVDKGVYELVRGKLTNLTENKPAPEHSKEMPAIVDESSKFLASPFPENEAEKRRLLADLMARKGDEILGTEGIYKLTYTEGGEEIMNAPVGIVKSQDENTKKEILKKVNSVIPEKKLQNLLKEPANEGSTYLSDIIKGRGEAMQVLHDEMKKENEKDLITVGKFSKTHGQGAEMLKAAPHFGGQKPSPVLVDKVSEKIKKIPTSGVSETAKPYVSGGLDAKALAALDEEKKVGGVSDKSGVNIVASSSRATAGIGEGLDKDDDERRRQQEEAQRRRQQEEAQRRRQQEEARRRQQLADERLRRAASGTMLFGYAEFDPEHEQAMQILHSQLRSRGGEIFYKQPHMELTHGQASEWLSMKPPMKVDKSVKESGDTARLHKKFERKLSNLVSMRTPPEMYDTMQDVIIECSRILSEYFVSQNYKVLVRIALISEMQKRGNEILIEVDDNAETFFFAAQRLKKATSLDVNEPCLQVSYHLIKKLEDITKCRSMARKLTSALKDHIKDAAHYLSANVTKPDEHIEAYVSLLNEMEAAGDRFLIEGDISKSYKDAAAYLRQLTSFQDLISLPNPTLQSNIAGKLKALMANVTADGYSKSTMDGVISESTKLLVSYIMLQGIKTEAFKILIDEMDREGDYVLLRHGNIRKTYSNGADLLRSKNTDQLNVQGADPVVARKIQIKLRNLMDSCTPDKYLTLMDDVIEDATAYLAVHFLQPQVIQVCKCIKNVFVQCELWSDEILRRVTKPCCTCARHISAQTLADLTPGTSRPPHGLDISITPCPSKPNRIYSNESEKPYDQPCPAKKPTDDCNKTTTSYLLHSTECHRRQHSVTPGRAPRTLSSKVETPSCSSMKQSTFAKMCSDNTQTLERYEVAPTIDIIQETDTSSPGSFHTPQSISSDSQGRNKDCPFWQSPTTMLARVYTPLKNELESTTQAIKSTNSINLSRSIASAKRGYNARAPIVTTDEMSDWHSMMVSLMWNVQAWRNWIQENIDRAVTNPSHANIMLEETWMKFQRQVTIEALQWRQYNSFTRQLTLRLAQRYRDKKIVSPTRATIKTKAYMECQDEMFDIIDMFSRWTQWLTAVVKETDNLKKPTSSNISESNLRWKHFKKKVEEYLEDWNKYNMHLKVCWEQKYKRLIADWLPGWSHSGPVWVVSACGAVPGGAVAAGVYEGEVTWVARTTHRCNVVPGALHPSKHCCIVYSDGGVHHYTKYQVMCNASVSWVACRAGGAGEAGAGVCGAGACGAAGRRAVRVRGGVLVGRVLYRGSHLVGAVHAPHYRCHVVIFGRPFAFNCYELLVLDDER
ncbi:unnamed protein product [Euphydryas editha]|uniref:Uncharacterized protein n=1 Tax=Euphydryas editha TaxID=104508 RepID=A0AAU9UXQ3_EUPED|nr:unnamed protein product [Euphydryas editha]